MRNAEAVQPFPGKGKSLAGQGPAYCQPDNGAHKELH